MSHGGEEARDWQGPNSGSCERTEFILSVGQEVVLLVRTLDQSAMHLAQDETQTLLGVALVW